ncbi:MAG: aldose epimerase [Actinomycetota bacterium]
MQSSAGTASVSVSAAAGGRLASLIVDGHELLVTDGAGDGLRWGSYPMVPWAGRIRDGRFRFDGREVSLPRNMPPHAIHGVGFTAAWEVIDEMTIRCPLDDPWPFGGVATQRFELDESGLTTIMRIEADEAMPVMAGWHPWFNRTLAGPDDAVSARLEFGPARMYELDDVEIPTGRLVDQPDGPWDNCFTELPAHPRISWPGILDLEVSSSCDHWVIYDQPANALCVEPQTAAPDVFNRNPWTLDAGAELVVWYRIGWA